MANELSTFLAGREPDVTSKVVWGNGLRLRLSAYLCDDMPPLAYVTSARAIVMRAESVLVAEDRDGVQHILPGGQIEQGEQPEAALRREVGEESGWLVEGLHTLGFLRYVHLDTMPADHPYPHPDFLQVVYVAEAIEHRPELMVEDDYAVGSAFLPAEKVRELPLTPAERVFLDAAWQAPRSTAASDTNCREATNDSV